VVASKPINLNGCSGWRKGLRGTASAVSMNPAIRWPDHPVISS
jgi:hypothetical protein